MKLKDIETLKLEALEQLRVIREEIIEATRERDKIKNQLTSERDALKIVESDRRRSESERAENLFVLEKTITQIDDRRTQATNL